MNYVLYMTESKFGEKAATSKMEDVQGRKKCIQNEDKDLCMKMCCQDFRAGGQKCVVARNKPI